MKRTTILIFALSAMLAVPALAAEADDVPRTASGKPDLTGNYDASTLTPFQRPREFGENLYLTPEEADKIVQEERAFIAGANATSDPDRDAPPEGGAAPVGFDEDQRETLGAGNVGGYNAFWIDRGSDVFLVDGKFRTSILVDPPDGRMPEMTEAARAEAMERRKLFRPNDGTAWWLDVDHAGPYDGPESLGIAERCVLGFTGAVPTFPSLYNNYKSIVQTDDYVMILIEMVHDARVVRMNSEHPGPEVRKWLGDSIGWWEGDTLVVDTTNFLPESRPGRGGSQDAHVVERFTKLANGDVLYRFTVEDPSVWTAAWTGEYVWRASENRVYEYACHEGNYAMGNVLRGARLLENEAREQGASGGE
ncbi:MAG: hypothetical protein R3190_01395 [Thermoanaerobaculia bacterium]|nr:hypothetical protein [Thermoanaerobaculia bacterium]